MNIVPCLTWVRRGVARSTPEKVKVDKEELKRIIEETKDQVDEIEDDEEADEENDENNDSDDKKSKGKKGKSTKTKENKGAGSKRKHDKDDIVDKYGLDDYDDEDDMMRGIGNLAYHASNEDDPYLTMKDEDSDDEDFTIKATDNLLVTGRAEKDMCSLEVHIYNEDLGNLYVHHDILLSSFPLAVEWLNFDIGEDKPGNFVAVGTMEPVIELWDLDVVDSLEPVAVLGTKMKSKKKKKSKPEGHSDAVLDLSWNSIVRNVLASASADGTVALWDLTEGKIVTSLTHHKDKVQCIAWHPCEQQTLLSGSFDKTVNVCDCRNPDDNFKSWNLGGEVEKVIWDTFNPFNYFATTDQGLVYYIDSRQDKPLFTLSAHEEAVTGLCQSSGIPGLFVTTSGDKLLKIWDIQDNKPSLVLSRNIRLNQLFCVGACPEAPFVFAVGGEKEVKVWDIRESAAVRKHFASRAPVGVTMEGEGDLAEEPDTEAMGGLTIDPSEQEDIDTIFGDSQTSTSTGASKKKKKKKKKKKPKQGNDESKE